MKVRYLGHSCVEVVGRSHILIDPDFTRVPEPGVKYILVTHAHQDHIGRLTEVQTGTVLASPDVCDIAAGAGIHPNRPRPVAPGDRIANIQVLPGFSLGNNLLFAFLFLLIMRRRSEPLGTPLSFLVKDVVDLLHIGDAHEAPLPVNPDILCLPWRSSPVRTQKYKRALIQNAEHFGAPFMLPVHHDIPPTDADPAELRHLLQARILEGYGWHYF